MSRRVRGGAARAAAIIACVAVIALAAAAQGAWAQKTVQTSDIAPLGSQTPGNADHKKGDSSDTREGATEDGKDEAEKPPEEQGDPHDGDKTSGDAEKSDQQSSGGAPQHDPTPQAEEVFKASITVGGRPVPCSYWVKDPQRLEVAIGTRTIIQQLPEYTFYAPALDDIDTAGDVEIPPTVTNGNSGITYKVATVGDSAFRGCTKLTSTGLAGNKNITSLEHSAYDHCDSLTTTGLEDNDTVTDFGLAVFQFDMSLTSTGLDRNATIRSLGVNMFQCCPLASTGLERNSTITTVPAGAFYQCNALTSTGLESNSTVRELGGRFIDHGVFQECANLVTTGLEGNHLIGGIGRAAFLGCVRLGGEATDSAEAGDLVLNGADGKLGIARDAFLNTGFRRVYLGAGIASTSFDEGALDTVAGSKIPVLHVRDEAPWNQMAEFSFGSTVYRRSDASLIVMAPQIGAMGAQRAAGTDDAVTVTFSTNHSFTASISDERGELASGVEIGVPGVEDGSQQDISCSIPGGLPRTPERLTARVDAFVYPVESTRRPYNSVAGAEAGCGLAGVGFKIVFEPNGGAGEMAPQLAECRAGAALDGLGFGLEHMAFNHWSTTEADSGDDNEVLVDRAPLEAIPAKQGDTVTLHAQWHMGLKVASALPGGGPLEGAGYTLNTSSIDGTAGMAGLTTDETGRHPIVNPPAQEGSAVWPLASGADGLIQIYWLSEGTYYLWNNAAPAGFNAAASPMRIVISDRDHAAVVQVDDVEARAFEDDAARLTVMFTPADSLPSTGRISAGRLQQTGALAVSAATLIAAGVLLHKRAQPG